MSTTKRVLSGNLAAWCAIGVNFMTQLLLVPLYLSHWDKNTYGLWLTLQSLINIFELFDYGHQGFLQNEFLRVGEKRRRLLRKMFWSAVVIGFCLGFAQVVGVIVGYASGLIPNLLGIAPGQAHPFGLLLVLNLVVWWFTGSVFSISGKLLGSIGYYSKLAWWGVGSSVVTGVIPAVAVLFGAGFQTAGIVQAIGIVFFNIPLAIYQWSLLNREGMKPLAPNWRLGLRNLGRSQFITVTTLLDRLRQDGIRVLLAPLAGTGATATFSTTRTGANVIQQGVGTITGPIMPELMRYLNLRDQARSEAAFGTIWMVVVAVMAPGAILLQLAAPKLFVWWTHGKINFDPLLFGTLTFTVLILAVGQPAVAVVQGNNLLVTRLIISILSAAGLFCGMFLLIPSMNVGGVGISLMIAEAISSIGYILQASRWMRTHRMQWPWKAFACAVASVAITGAALSAIIWHTQLDLLIVIAFAFIAQTFIVVTYWHTLPIFARKRIANVMENKFSLLRQKKARPT